ncbi:MAG: PepSY domain-containing protein [Rhodospirillales bacterium]|nr:PepSY domain-containing protein [Rhodospirillales bacterium]
MKFLCPTLSLGAFAVLAGLAGPALAEAPSASHSMMQTGQRHQNSATVQTAQDVAGSPKLGFNDALQIALKAQPGSVVNEELEKEPGGSGLRYSFDVKSGADTREVGVDAMNGALLENRVEGPNPD